MIKWKNIHKSLILTVMRYPHDITGTTFVHTWNVIFLFILTDLESLLHSKQKL